MERRYELALGGVLVAAALAAGIVTGMSGAGRGAGDGAQAGSGSTPPVASAPPSSPAATGYTPSPSADATDSASASASATAPASPRCHTNDLNPTVTLVPGGPDGRGFELLNLTLTDTSGHVCTVYGFPGMKLQDADENGQATDVVRIAGAKSLITLADGQSASTSVEFLPDSPDAAEPQSGPCEPASSLLEITPPDETTQLDAQIDGGPVTACHEGLLKVYAFVAGDTGPDQ
jgi:Protein of unknown function (DUF4232)